MRRIGVLTTAMIVCLCCLGVAASASAQDGGFDGVVRAVDARYHVHGRRVPMMWAISLVARGYTHGGVRGLRVVEFEGLRSEINRGGLDEMVRSELGSGWSPMVRQRSLRQGSGQAVTETSTVWVQPAGKRMRMVVVNLEGTELNLVRMELIPEALAKWDEKGGE